MDNRLKLLLIGGNIWYFGEGLLGPLFAVFAQKIGGDIFEITSAWAIYLIVAGIMTIAIGKYSDSPKRKEWLLVIGYALNAAFTFGYLFVNNPAGLFIVQIGLGIASAMATPTWDALYSQYGSREKSGYEWGLAGGWPHILTGIAAIAGGLIVTYLSFEALFIAMGAIQVIAAAYQAKILRE